MEDTALKELKTRMIDLVNETLAAASRQVYGAGADTWSPAVDLIEHPEGLEIRCELPGVAEDQIEVAFESHQVVIRGYRPGAKVGDDGVFRQMERGTGSFTRVFPLPPGSDAAAAQTGFALGVLRIDIPKAVT